MEIKHLIAMILAVIPGMALGSSWLELEQYGGQAYYKRFDKGLTYTPFSCDPTITDGTGLPAGTNYTKITYTGLNVVFDANDLNKAFCGLFVHQNPGDADTNYVDLFYPNLVGSRYSKIVHVIDGKNVLVDFEYNGKSQSMPQVATNQKGYVFFDNSAAWSLLMAEYLKSDNTNTEIRLREYSITNILQTTYVIPQYTFYSLRDKELKIWTGTRNKARIKLGIEDYFQWGGIGPKAYWQSAYLFKNNAYDKNIVIHNVAWLPPHRTVLEASNFTRSFFGGPPTIGPCERILAVIGNTALDEKRDIESEAGLTDESFKCMGLGFLYSGGKYAGSGVAEDMSAYQYVFIKDFEHTGTRLIDLKANSGAGNYLVMQNVTTDFTDEAKWEPPVVLAEGRFTADKSGFDTGLVARTYYPDEVFEITSAHSFHQVDNSYLLDGWGNAANIIQIDRFAFTIGNHGTWDEIYENVYSEGLPKFKWNIPAGSYKIRTGRKQMIAQRIPRAGSRYTISRDYTVSGGIPRAVEIISTNIVRGFANWSVILQKTIAQINPATDVPFNAKPIQLQAGDRFSIAGRGGEVYTVLDNNRGPYSQFNSEYNGQESYNYSRHTLDKNLPADLPLAFEIDVIESTSEYLLDGTIRPAYLIYKSNQYWNSTTNSRFGDATVLLSNPTGHISYNHRQFALWADNVQHNGYYRQSSSQDGTLFPVGDPDTGATQEVNRLGWHSPGYVLINSSGFQGQFCSYFDDFYLRDLIQRSLGMNVPENQKAKLRLYHCSNINTSGVVGAGRFVESYETDFQAPDMPAPCRNLLNALPAPLEPVTTAKVWNATSGLWTDGTRWTPDGVPGDGDDAVLPSGSYTVTLSGPSSILKSYTQNGGTLLFTNVDSCLRAAEVTISSGKMDHAKCDTNAAPGATNRVYIMAVNLSVGSNGLINVDGRGFPGTTNAFLYGQGPGGGTADANNYGGAGHGGLGGGIYPGSIYDSTMEPSLPGSGGGARRAGETGGAGGGVVRIVASGRVTLNGAVTANGGHAASYAGGGSGGSIWISCQTFDGSTGRISAKGGKGNTYHGGSGGGGRIAVLYDSAAQNAAGLTPGVVFGVGSETQNSWAPAGASGTLYLPDDQILPSYWLSGAVVTFPSSFTQLTATYSRLTFIGGGLVHYTVPAQFTVTDVLSVTGNVVSYDGVLFAADTTLNVNGRVAITNAMITFASPVSDMTVGGDFSAFNGTLTVRTNLAVNGTLRLAGGSSLYAYSESNRPTVMTCAGDFTMITNSKLYVYAADTNANYPLYGALVSVAGDMKISSNSWVYPGVWNNVNSNKTLGPVLFRLNNLTISSNAGFNADYAGYSGGKTNWFFHGFGPGGGYKGGSTAGGGGYGGTGGYFFAAGSYGKPYGSATNSNRHGSGGSLSGDNRRWVSPAGNGGGVIWIQAAGDVAVDGTLKADGEANISWNGGGSGGGILVQAAGNFSGAAGSLVSAKGGDAVNYNSGGGGGGRVAVWHRMTPALRDAIANGSAAESRILTAASYPAFAGNVWVTGGTGSVIGTKGTALFLTEIPLPGTLILIR